MLRTRSPLSLFPVTLQEFSFDLHVLTTPPAFILSQDQTLRKNFRRFMNPRIHELLCRSR
ncbi:MAG: hypothetical protein DRP71_13800 [Verrucomicrobia bacterium]|nr:MAG: hypothetical protein DRP71_13800 [Verrucomicrobiota bacterium]